MNSKYRYIIQSSVLRTEKPVELNKFNKKILAANMDETERAISALPVDVEDWLPAASKQYHISPKLEDYIIVPVIAFFSDLPNRNSVGFPLQELIKFNPERGACVYKTWKGQPTFQEHRNNDITAAKGVIFDSVIRPVNDFQGDLVKVILLTGWDKTKDPILCNKILTNSVNSFSMGAYANDFRCSICGKSLSNGGCRHIDVNCPQMRIIDGNLCFMNGIDLAGFECSFVENPAYIMAQNPSYIEVSKV